MKKLNKGKLTLDRETLVPLVRDDLGLVAGGQAVGTLTPTLTTTTTGTTTLTTTLSRGLGCPPTTTRTGGAQ